MNYNGFTNQTQPELPILAQIPIMLAAYPQWFNYDDKPVRTAPRLMKLEDAYQACLSHDLGLGFMLVDKTPIVAIVIHDCYDDTGQVRAWAYDIVGILDSYTEASPELKKIFVFVAGHIGEDYHSDQVSIINDGGFVPVTGNRYGYATDVAIRQKEIRNIITDYIRPKWTDSIDRLTEPEQGVYESVLKSCLGSHYWLESPSAPDILDLIAKCWQFTACRLMVHEAIGEQMWSRERRQDYEKAILERLPPKTIRDKGDKEKSNVINPGALEDMLQKDGRGNTKENYYNMALILEHHPDWSGRLRFDEFGNVSRLDGNSVTDAIESDIAMWLGKHYGFGGNSPKMITRAVYTASANDTYDPLIEWLDSLPEWDREPRLETWLSDYCGADPNKMQIRWIGKAIILQMVARALKPGCMARLVPIFEGEENTGKTRAIKLLGEPWSVTFDMSMDSKEAHMAVAGTWVAELSELDTMKKTTETRLKSFISQQDDAYIPKFSNHLVRHPRRTVFFGTTNESSYLKSGDNTRWLPVETGLFDLDGLEAIRFQLFAEALYEIKFNPEMQWWSIPSDITSIIENDREQRTEVNVYEDDLRRWLDGDGDERDKEGAPYIWREKISWRDIAEGFLGTDKRADWSNKQFQWQIFEVLKKIGWINIREANRRFWVRKDDHNTSEVPF